MQEFLHFLIAQIVDDVDSIAITQSSEGDTLRFDIKLSEGEYGKVIGKSGKTINAIKTLLYVFQAKTQQPHQQIFINIA